MKNNILIIAFLLLSKLMFAQPACSGNPPAGNTCASATPICDLNGYCGDTFSNTADEWGTAGAPIGCGFLGLGACPGTGIYAGFCGSIENNSFISFVASSTSISIDVWITSSSQGDGIQVMIFETATCGTGDITSFYCDQITPNGGASTNVSASGLVIGNTYFIMIDGFAGDQVEYVIGANTGVQIPVSVSPTSSTICLGSTASITASGGDGTYTWNADPNLNTTTGATVVASPPAVGTYNYIVNSATGNPLCPSTTNATATVIVTSNDDASFTLTSFCAGQSNIATIVGTAGGTFVFNPAVTDGATVNVSTGEITNGVAGSTYIIEYSTPTGACQSVSTQSVTISANDDASFTLASFCTGQTNSATITGTAGGTFAFNPAVTDGATVNSSTGEITNGVAGTTYIVEYTTPIGACQNTFTQSVTITNNDDASFTLTSFCAGQSNTATITGTAGGTFVFNPAVTDGATVNVSTGEITNGVAGTTYTVEYTTPVGVCQNTSTQNVTITANDDASFTLTSFCYGQTNSATIIGTAGGTFNFNPAVTDGATVNSSTGEISNGIAGTAYIVEYTTPAGACQSSSTQTVTVTANDDASFSLTSFCAGQSNVATITGTSGGTFVFNPAVTDGASVNSSTGEISNGVAGTTYIVEYTTPTGACQSSSTQSITVTNNDDASFTLTSFCDGQANTATITGTTGGTFVFNPTVTDGATVNASTGEISNGVAGTTYTVEYTTPTGACQNISTQNVTVNPNDDASFTITPFCAGQTNTANVTGITGGSFSFNPIVTDGASINTSTGEITNGVAGTTYTVEYTTPNGACQNTSTQSVLINGVTATINASTQSGTAPLDVFFGNGSTTGNGISYFWDLGNGVTSSIFEPSTTYINDGTFNITLLVTDQNGCSSSDIITINVIGISSLIIPNIFTPNGDGNNDNFSIKSKNILSIDVQIFNRWRQKLYSWNNIGGFWDGKNAPDGTYFYIIKAQGQDGIEYLKKGGLTLIK